LTVELAQSNVSAPCASRLYLPFLFRSVVPPRPTARYRHPLDALTFAEHWVVYDVIRDSGRLPENGRYAGVSLMEPLKGDVLAWTPGAPVPRHAKAILMIGPTTVEAVVDIGGRTLTSWREILGVQPNITAEELQMQDGIAKASPEVLAALKRRGLTDLTTIECLGVTRGYYAIAEEGSRRLAAASCLVRHGVENIWGRPVDGLTIYIDLHEKKVFRVVDTVAVPVPTAPADFHPKAIGPTRPALASLDVTQPMGPGFTRSGATLTWDRWQFHLRLEPRRGAVISLVKYKDGDRDRSVLYQGSVSELFVPYMDPDEGWYHRTFFDGGELGHALGLARRPLQRGTDCPSNAVWLDLVIASERGLPQRQPDTGCIFERAAGDILWRASRGRASRQPREPRSRRSLDRHARQLRLRLRLGVPAGWLDPRSRRRDRRGRGEGREEPDCSRRQGRGRRRLRPLRGRAHRRRQPRSLLLVSAGRRRGRHEQQPGCRSAHEEAAAAVASAQEPLGDDVTHRAGGI
jgi:Cu2+-containing amine oxidase